MPLLPSDAMPDLRLEPSWKSVLSAEFSQPYWETLTKFVRDEMAGGDQIFPHPKNIFAAFDRCPFENVNVVILGQDPYHSQSTVNKKTVPTAHGLCFSVVRGAPLPPSLRNIFKEIAAEVPGYRIPEHGNLTQWSEQGVLLINSTLTVRAHQPMSHANQGWETFTDAAIRAISDQKSDVVFLLWGRHARAKASLIDTSRHHVLEAPHPSPFSASSGFFGCEHFKKTNEILKKLGKKTINWQT